MAYPWIHLLATLFFASSLNLPLPPAGTQIDDDLIQSTILSLNRQVDQALDTETFEQPFCRTEPHKSQSLQTVFSGHSGLAKTGNQPPGPPTDDGSQADKVANKMPIRQPSGCLIVRIPAAPQSATPSTGVKATLASTRKSVKRTASSAPTRTTQPGSPSGCYLFRIEQITSVKTGPALNIDPRILPNYQFTADPYWQYYSDCDQWNIVFTAAEEAPGPVAPNQNLASFLVEPHLALRDWLATEIDWTALSQKYQNSVWPVLEGFTATRSAELAGNEMPSPTRLDTSPLQSDQPRQPNLATCWFSIATHWILKEAMETELLHSPNTWLDHQIDFFDRHYGETLPGTMARELTRSVKREMQVKRKRQAESEMKRGFATRINWLSIQLKRVANAMDETAEESQKVIRENDQPDHY